MGNVYEFYVKGLAKLESPESYIARGETLSNPQPIRGGKTFLATLLEEKVMQVINPDYKTYEPAVPFSASAFYSTETLNISLGALADITDQQPETQADFSYKGGVGDPPTEDSLVYVDLDFGERWYVYPRKYPNGNQCQLEQVEKKSQSIAIIGKTVMEKTSEDINGDEQIAIVDLATIAHYYQINKGIIKNV